MSIETRFISDPHFGHKNLAHQRGFATADEMDEHIITEWNKIVRKKDITYLLGDITMEKKNYSILDRLNGKKHVVGGNHDQKQHTRAMLKFVDSFAGAITYRRRYYLTHIPIHPSQTDKRINIHGHVHEHTIMTYDWDFLAGEDREIPNPRYFNVSMEALDYTPHTLEQLTKKYIK